MSDDTIINIDSGQDFCKCHAIPFLMYCLKCGRVYRQNKQGIWIDCSLDDNSFNQIIEIIKCSENEE